MIFVARLSLIVFDLDGTLIDSRKDLSDSANTLLRAHGGSPLSDDRIADMVGGGALLLIRRVFAAAGLGEPPPSALPAFLDIYDERLLAHTRPYDGVADVLAALHRQFPLAVLTNKPLAHTQRILDELGFSPYFRWVLGGDDPIGRKPAPAGLRRLMEDARATADACLMVGDSAIDLETARNAGTRICLARYGFGYRFGPDDLRGDELIVDRPEDLLRIVASVNRG